VVDEFDAFVEAICFEGIGNVWVDLYVLGTAFHFYQQIKKMNIIDWENNELVFHSILCYSSIKSYRNYYINQYKYYYDRW
jgi:hypothetical protein